MTIHRKNVLFIMNIINVYTCHGYSFSTVSTPPTILVLVWTLPQLQGVAMVLLEIVVVTGNVVVGGNVVVEVVKT